MLPVHPELLAEEFLKGSHVSLIPCFDWNVIRVICRGLGNWWSWRTIVDRFRWGGFLALGPSRGRWERADLQIDSFFNVSM